MVLGKPTPCEKKKNTDTTKSTHDNVSESESSDDDLDCVSENDDEEWKECCDEIFQKLKGLDTTGSELEQSGGLIVQEEWAWEPKTKESEAIVQQLHNAEKTLRGFEGWGWVGFNCAIGCWSSERKQGIRRISYD